MEVGLNLSRVTHPRGDLETRTAESIALPNPRGPDDMTERRNGVGVIVSRDGEFEAGDWRLARRRVCEDKIQSLFLQERVIFIR